MAATRASLDRKAARLARAPGLDRTITVRVPEYLHRALEIEATECQVRFADTVRTALLSYALATQPGEVEVEVGREPDDGSICAECGERWEIHGPHDDDHLFVDEA